MHAASRSPTLLLVSDEALSGSTWVSCLEPLGARILTTLSISAVESFERDAPEVVVLIATAPEWDWIAVLRRIRAHPARSGTPVILLSEPAERHRLSGLEVRADDYLDQSPDGALLLARIQTLLALEQTRELLQIRGEELDRAKREQRDLTQFIEHELQAPLSGILASSEWVHEQLQRRDMALLRGLEDVLSHAGRLRSMIQNVISVSQLDRGAFPVKRRNVQVSRILRGVTNAFARAADSRQIALIEAPESSAFMQLDPILVQRVLENVLENALRYTPDGGRIFLGAQVVGGCLEITIANSGPPVLEGERQLIFEKFTRGSNALPSKGNAGLGLYFCKRAVEAHGGSIEVLETDEYPACFVVRLSR